MNTPMRNGRAGLKPRQFGLRTLFAMVFLSCVFGATVHHFGAPGIAYFTDMLALCMLPFIARRISLVEWLALIAFLGMINALFLPAVTT